jgi:hypothetical protein
MSKFLLLTALLGLPGCATIERHPYATAFASAVVAGSIAAAVQHHHDQNVVMRAPQYMSGAGPNCSNTAVCQ